MSGTQIGAGAAAVGLNSAGSDPVDPMSTGGQLLALGWEVNANQYRLVHLAARFDEELDWYRQGLKSASHWIAQKLGVGSGTAREWVRVGHALRGLPLTDAAFAAQQISYAKARIVTRWADADNEERLLRLAHERTADRLTTAIAKALAEDGETDEERDLRLHDQRSFTTWTDGDGMTVIRMALPPSVAKPVVAAIDELVRQIAQTPCDDAVTDELLLDGSPSATPAATMGGQDLSADATDRPTAVDPPHTASPIVAEVSDPLPGVLREMRRRWQPAEDTNWIFPSLAQQRADAFIALFLGCGVDLTTELVVHVRGDGLAFDDGTPTTSSAVVRQLDQAFIRLLIHDADRRPINASSRRRKPTTRQKRVVMEAHNHECTECQSTDLLELHHNPPYKQTGHTVTNELEPRCGPCHDAHHRDEGHPGPTAG